MARGKNGSNGSNHEAPHLPSAGLPPDDNLENLIDNWRHYRDKIVLFLGAGASFGARNVRGEPLPMAWQLRDDIWREFLADSAAAAQQGPLNLGLMSLEHVAALAVVKAGPLQVRQFVADRCEVRLPLWQHAVLPFLAPRALLTPNYDDLVEIGWRVQEHRPGVDRCEPVFSPLTTDPRHRVPVFKPHGSAQYFRKAVGEGGLVLTQFDYFAMIEKRDQMLRQFLGQLTDGCVVFAGYSFFDMDIASCLYQMRRADRGVNWYAVFPRADANVRRMYEQHFGILQIDRLFDDFLAELDRRLDLFPVDWKPTQIPALVAAGRIQS